MTPEQHRDRAIADFRNAREHNERDILLANYHATMGVLEALLQFDTCGHGTRGLCKHCLLNDLRDNQPWTVEVRKP